MIFWPATIILCGLQLLVLFSSSESTSVSVSNIHSRLTERGNVVGAQDGNIINKKWNHEFALVGIAYGDCVYQGCENTTFGACGFGQDIKILVWTSPTLGDGTTIPCLHLSPQQHLNQNTMITHVKTSQNPNSLFFCNIHV